MGIAYRYVEGANLIVTVWDGRVTSAEWTDLACRQADDSTFLRARRRLTDARTANVSNLADNALAISARFQGNIGGVRLAVVTNFSREIAHKAENSPDARDITSIAFNNIETATAWLDVDTDIVSAAIRLLHGVLRDQR
jgi:hypothetical protein